ncbi:MAG: trypsin-like peptidase domain-containing protein [Oscillospiraceae bacterium]|nr:trypsin-like peptidase domain-containing protein [Oscillospiraceae bacterium]
MNKFLENDENKEYDKNNLHKSDNNDNIKLDDNIDSGIIENNNSIKINSDNIENKTSKNNDDIIENNQNFILKEQDSIDDLTSSKENINNNEYIFQYNKDDNNSESFNSSNTIQNKHKHKFILLILIISIIGISIISISIITTLNNSNQILKSQENKNQSSHLNINPSPDNIDKTNLSDDNLSISDIAERVTPSVVGVVVYNQTLSFKPTGQGSGVIMSKDGYIITNAHVIMNENGSIADGIKVVLNNQEEYEATVIGTDSKTDLAVIKINANNLTPAEFGDSQSIKVGVPVIAIGNPSGIQLAGSVTKGIISAVGRDIQEGYSTTFLQTDAAINPGNSGGALVNMNGQVIGINSSKISAVDFEGIGFSIPIGEAKPIIDSLINYGYVKDRVVLGISYSVIDKVLARLNNIPSGLRIMNIDKNSDIFLKGVKVGDIITEADGNKIESTNDLVSILKEKKPGNTVSLVLFRISSIGQNNTITVTITLEEDKGDILQGS